MALPIFQRTVTNSAGDVIEGAQVSVFDESTGLLSTIYSNREGTTALSNPFFTGSDGLASFYAQQGEYRISVSSVAGSVTWRYQPLIGTLDEGAAVLQAGIYAQESAGYANTAIDARDAAIGAANYKGNWEGKTGAGVIGESYLHKASFIYRLNVNLANLSTSEPSPTNTDWVFIQEVPFEAPCKPTLDLDFANQKAVIYSKLEGFVEKPFADIVSQGRATAGSSVDAIGGITEFASGENRFTFDGETGEALGYLSEEARTNLIIGSESFPYGFSNVYSQPYTANQVVAPDGTMTADTILGQFISSSSRLNKNYNFTIGTICTISWFEKSIDGTFDDTMIPLSGVGISFVKNPRVSVGGGWYRYSYQFTCTSDSQTLRMYYHRWNASLNLGETYAFWGMQLEVGSFPTSYIKTLGTAVTRTADSMTRTLGQEWNPNEGTFVVEFDDWNDVNFSFLFSFGLNSSNYIGVLQDSIGRAYIECKVGGTISAQAYPLIYAINSKSKIAISFESLTNTLSISVNGSEVASSVGISQIDLSVYTSILNGRSFAGNISTVSNKRLQYYPRVFDALTLQRLSRIQ